MGPLLDALLLTAVLGWVCLATAALLDRARHDRRVSRMIAVRNRLRVAEDGELERIAGRLSLADVGDLVSDDDLPGPIAERVAQALLAGKNQTRIVEMAKGRTTTHVLTRIRAAQILVAARAGTAHFVLDGMLRSTHRQLATGALRMLVRLNDRRSARLLIRALADGVFARSRIAAAFHAMSVERVDMLGTLLRSDEAIVRYWGARLALFLDATQWADTMRGLVNDRNPLVRRAAVEVIGALGEERDVKVVIELFDDPAPAVRAHAVRASAAFSSPGLVAAWRRLRHDEAAVVRLAASDLLATQPAHQHHVAPLPA